MSADIVCRSVPSSLSQHSGLSTPPCWCRNCIELVESICKSSRNRLKLLDSMLFGVFTQKRQDRSQETAEPVCFDSGGSSDWLSAVCSLSFSAWNEHAQKSSGPWLVGMVVLSWSSHSTPDRVRWVSAVRSRVPFWTAAFAALSFVCASCTRHAVVMDQFDLSLHAMKLVVTVLIISHMWKLRKSI